MPIRDPHEADVTSEGAAALDWLVPLLRCPRCRGQLALAREDERTGTLAHAGGPCAEVYPVIDGIPRLLLEPHRAGLVASKRAWAAAHPELAARWRGRAAADAVVRGFDFEWSLFREAVSADIAPLFSMYFDLVPAWRFAPSAVALDAGCGAGRWARAVAARGPRVIALDLGESIDVALANDGASDRIAFVQADVRTVPLADGAADWAYSLGVLHHVDAPDVALREIARTVRPGGVVLLYLYYALDQRGPLFRGLFRAVDLVRRVTSRAPRPVALGFSTAVALAVYWPLARACRVLARLGARRLADALPLSFYRDRSLRTMLNDSLDRFGTRAERRYTREEMRLLMAAAGLADVRFSPLEPYWHAVATRAGRA